jgi:hypothetical protein
MRVSAASRLLGLRVRIPSAAWIFGLVSVVVSCHVQVSAMGRPLVQRFRIECGVSEYVLETSKMRRPRPLGLSSHKKK